MKFTAFEEVRNTYYDEVGQYTAVDAWYPNEDEGICVCKVFDNGRVEYQYEEYADDPSVVDAVNEILQGLK